MMTLTMTNTDNQQLFREVMGNYPTGVTVITATDSEWEPSRINGKFICFSIYGSSHGSLEH